ncbi:MAG TPA: hypothetical protein VFH68_17210 [Polyangia bacterium]|nr:hypothetical protein [Polyangia bacterium]
MVNGRRAGRSTVALAAAGLTVLGGCFTEPINRNPARPSIQPVAPVVRGAPASFDIDASDPDDGDSLTLSWGVTGVPCPDDPTPERWTGGDRHGLDGDHRAKVSEQETLTPFCLCAFAVDSHGASSTRCLPYDPQNQAPTAIIKMVKPGGDPPYALYSEIQLSAAGSSDPVDMDHLTYDWVLSPPTGSNASTGACRAGVLCSFTADVDGDYDVTLTVSDGMNGRGMATQKLKILPDRLPCIDASEPSYLVQSVVRDPWSALPQDTTFKVTQVDDDGAPYPANAYGETHFIWYLGHGDEGLIPQDRDFSTFPVPPKTFDHGEVGRIRVEIWDNQQNKQRIDTAFLSCHDAQCGVVPGCLQRVTWSVQY